MKKHLAKVMVAALIFSLLAACTPAAPASSSAAEGTTAAPAASASEEATEAATEAAGMTYGGNDISEKVALRYLMVGTRQIDQDEVFQAMSDYVEPIINATISWELLDMADHETRYSLVLASGEEFDLAVTAQGWLHYDTSAPAGAYKEITLDMIHQYMPLTTEHQTDIELHMDMNRLGDGKVYMVPASFINLTGNNRAVAYREDLRLGYDGVEPVTDLATLEAFMDAVKANNPEMWPYAAAQNNNELKALMYSVQNNIFQLPGTLIEELFAFQYTPGMTAEDAAAAVMFTGDRPEYLAYVTKMKEWADKGYWSQSAIADQTFIKDAYENSQSAVFTQNTGTLGASNNTLRSNDIEPGMVDLFPTSNRYMGVTNSGVAIPFASPNPERALMFLDLLKYDQTLYELYRWGVEGRHWEWVDEAQRIWQFGPERDDYVFGQGSWGFSSPEFEPRYGVDDDPQGTEIFNAWWADDIATQDPLAGLNIDQTPIQNEISALTNIRSEYMYLLDLGLVDDPAAYLTEMNTAMRDAGLDTVKAEIDTQIAAFIAKNA